MSICLQPLLLLAFGRKPNSQSLVVQGAGGGKGGGVDGTPPLPIGKDYSDEISHETFLTQSIESKTNFQTLFDLKVYLSWAVIL